MTPEAMSALRKDITSDILDEFRKAGVLPPVDGESDGGEEEQPKIEASAETEVGEVAEEVTKTDDDGDEESADESGDEGGEEEAADDAGEEADEEASDDEGDSEEEESEEEEESSEAEKVAELVASKIGETVDKALGELADRVDKIEGKPRGSRRLTSHEGAPAKTGTFSGTLFGKQK